MILCTLHLIHLRIGLYLRQDEVDFLHLKVDDVVHQSLCKLCMTLKQIHIEACMVCEWVDNVWIEIQRKESTTIVWTEWNLTTWVRWNGLETKVCITIRNTLSDNCIPKQYAWLGTLPCVMYNLFPQCLSRNLLRYAWLAAIGRELLYVCLIFNDCLHELIGNLHRHISTGHLTFFHLGIDKRLWIWMLNTYWKHQGTTTTILRYLTSTVWITLHERNKTRWSQGWVVHWWAFRADMSQVMSYSTTTLHQLHLLFVNTHNGTIRIGITVQTDYETVGKRCHLIVITNTRHRTTSRDNISEMVQEVENLLCRQRVLIFVFNTSYLVSNAPMHLFWRLLIDISEAILHRILVDPHTGSKFVSTEIS